MNIVGLQLTAAQFATYVKGLNLPGCDWHPEFVVQHNTGSPTLAQRPNGLTKQHLLNLADYYQGQGWHAGPHLFVDDVHINVFSPLTAPGVHSPSWNHVSFGVEMLGDYDSEDFNSGRGLAVHQNAVAAIAVLSHYGGIDSASMKMHFQDPGTSHKDCPGTSARDVYEHFMADVHDYIVANLA